MDTGGNAGGITWASSNLIDRVQEGLMGYGPEKVILGPEPAIPFESFSQDDAQGALSYATEIVELVRARIPTQ